MVTSKPSHQPSMIFWGIGFGRKFEEQQKHMWPKNIGSSHLGYMVYWTKPVTRLKIVEILGHFVGGLLYSQHFCFIIYFGGLYQVVQLTTTFYSYFYFGGLYQLQQLRNDALQPTPWGFRTCSIEFFKARLDISRLLTHFLRLETLEWWVFNAFEKYIYQTRVIH